MTCLRAEMKWALYFFIFHFFNILPVYSGFDLKGAAVSILVFVELALDASKSHLIRLCLLVSILVFVELALDERKYDRLCDGEERFQSLFS